MMALLWKWLVWAWLVPERVQAELPAGLMNALVSNSARARVENACPQKMFVPEHP
jgi:hypothetical protein